LDILLLLLLLVLDLLLMLLILPFGTTPSVAATVTPHAAAEPLPLGLYGTILARDHLEKYTGKLQKKQKGETHV